MCIRDRSRGTLVWLHFSSPFSSKLVVCGRCLVTLSLTINETLTWLSLMPVFKQKSFWWWQCSDRCIIPPSPCPLPPIFLSLISLMVFVDVKNHVYLLTSTNTYKRTYIYAHTRTHTHTLTVTHIHTFTHTQTHKCTYTHTCTDIHTQRHTHRKTHTNAHAHVDTHTIILRCSTYTYCSTYSVFFQTTRTRSKYIKGKKN